MRPFSPRSCNMRNSAWINRYSPEARFYVHRTFSRGGVFVCEIFNFSPCLVFICTPPDTPVYCYSLWLSRNTYT